MTQAFLKALEEINGLVEQKRLNEAILRCQNLLKTYKGNADLWLRLGMYTQLSGNDTSLDEINIFLEKANEYAQKSGFSDVELANFEYTVGDIGIAEKLFTEARERAKQYLNETTIGLMKCHLEKGEKEIAKSLVKELTDAPLTLDMSLVLADLEDD